MAIKNKENETPIDVATDEDGFVNQQIGKSSGFDANKQKKEDEIYSYWSGKSNFGIFIPIIVAVVLLLLFNLAEEEIDRMLLAEKVIEKKFEIELIAEQTDRFIEKSSDWDSNYDHYISTILISVEMLDQLEMTYAAVFDENLENLSARSPSYEGSPFEPETHQEFVDAIHNTEMGDLIIPFTPPGAEMRDMYLHYRWIPSDSSLDNRVLAVVAISKYSVNTNISTWVQVAAIIVVIAAVIIAIFVWRRRLSKITNKKLENVVKERTAELERQTLAAEKSSMAKTEFLARMSHEIRTPLNAIIGLSHVSLHASEEGSKVYDASRDVITSAKHLTGILNDILDMTKLEDGTLGLIIAPFSFKEAMSEVVGMIKDSCTTKHLTLVDNVKELPTFAVNGDKMHLNQILLNLLSNAVKFSKPQDSINFRVDCEVNAEQKTVDARFTVIDEGIGIPKEQLEKIYDAFEQADPSISTDFGGVGLGLSISQELVNLMGGAIKVHSELDKGSTFTFALTFPLVEHFEDSDDTKISFANLEGKRIMIAEDVEINRMILQEFLAETKAMVEEAEDGRIAYEMFESSPLNYYDLILMDIRMPNMDGYESTEKIRALDRQDAKDIPIIAVTANAYKEDIDAAIKAGMNKFLAKPVNFEQLSHVLKELLT